MNDYTPKFHKEFLIEELNNHYYSFQKIVREN
jgi:hypothetical protein